MTGITHHRNPDGFAALLGSRRGLPAHVATPDRHHPLGVRGPLLDRLLETSVARLDDAALNRYRYQDTATHRAAQREVLLVVGADRRFCLLACWKRLSTLFSSYYTGNPNGYEALSRACLGLLMADRTSIYATRMLIGNASELLGEELETWVQIVSRPFGLP